MDKEPNPLVEQMRRKEEADPKVAAKRERARLADEALAVVCSMHRVVAAVQEDVRRLNGAEVSRKMRIVFLCEEDLQGVKP